MTFVPLTEPVSEWFTREVGQPFDFQRAVWAAQLRGESGLLHAPTGTGKTLAAFAACVSKAWDAEHPTYGEAHLAPKAPATDIDTSGTSLRSTSGGVGGSISGGGLRVLWITPLRALATDTERALRDPLEALGLDWRVERRTSDVSSSIRARQRKRLPEVLVTTPESLSVLLSYADAHDRFRGLHTVIVDEWHELMSTKRGVQCELGLARLRQWNPSLVIWGLSATLGNLDEAMAALLGSSTDRGRLVHGQADKRIELRTLIPDDAVRFPWAGHLGVSMLKPVADAIDSARSTLLFTNTRSQAEIWFRQLLDHRPDWLGRCALHHGSIDRNTRYAVEQMLRDGEMKLVVCTSSLDLGVDFSPVDQVIQLASPKGVARLMQRAGRSGHQPGAASVVVGAPTHALELLDFAAARWLMERKRIESRPPIRMALDVLAQHLVTVAMGGGFEAEALFGEVRGAHAFSEMTREQFDWVLRFVERGGDTLGAYPQFARVVEEPAGSGRYTVAGVKIARDHRVSIGTITSDATLDVRFANGRKLGTVEESFVGWLKPGQRFVFAGRMLELIAVRDMTATVRPAKGTKATTPRWQGGRTPLSTQLSAAVRIRLAEAKQGVFDGPEMRAVAGLLGLQQAWSSLPGPDELLVERHKTRDGYHVFFFPLRGRSVHEGLGALLAYRLTQSEPRTVTVTVNDYGLELLSPEPFESDPTVWKRLLSRDQLLEDLLVCVRSGALARRQFRDIARIAGLVHPGMPGRGKASRHLQASSELFFDVFTEFDPDNLLLDQARREVLSRQLELSSLRDALTAIADHRMVVTEPDRLTPLAFPLWAERLRQQHVSSESWRARVQRMAASLEDLAGAAPATASPASRG
ncbi:MAG: ligase-associated DNA damage response DEXH box helicase [Planctomycetota bacterium]